MGVCDIDRMGIDDNSGIDDCDNVVEEDGDDDAVGVDVHGKSVGQGGVEDVVEVKVVVVVANAVVMAGVAVVRIGGARRRAVRHETHDVRNTRRWAADKRGLDCLNSDVDLNGPVDEADDDDADGGSDTDTEALHRRGCVSSIW